MAITVKYKGVSLTFDKMPTPQQIQQKYEDLYGGIPAFPKREQVELLPVQEQIWFFDQVEPGNSVYNIPMIYQLDGPLDTNALRQALQAILDRHDALRTAFVKKDGAPVQIVAEEMTLACEEIDLSGLPDGEREGERQARIEAELARGFDLARGPLLRVQIYKETDHRHILLIHVHHIVFDGWSVNVLMKELADLYAAFAQGQAAELPSLPIQFHDFVQWFGQRLEKGELDAQRDYWLEELAGELPSFDLVPDFVRPPVIGHEGRVREMRFDAALTAQLRDLASKNGVTLYMLMLAAVNALLRRMTGSEDLILGTPVAGRTKEQMAGLIGYFVNMLPLRVRVNGDEPFTALLAHVKEKSLQALHHQEYPFKSLVETLNPERDPSRTPIFQTVMTYADLSDGGQLGEASVTPIPAPLKTVKFDLGFGFVETADGLQVGIDYRTDLYRDDTIDRLLGHLHQLLQSITADPTVAVDRLAILTAEQRRELIEDVNQTENRLPAVPCVHQLVEQQAALHPDKTAVQFYEQQLTYAELNTRANRLAHWLRARGVTRDTAVVLLLDQGIDMIVCMLAAMKAGGAYMPLDPTYPQGRLHYMIEDSKSPVVLTQAHHGHLLDGLASFAGATLAIDTEWDRLAGEEETDPELITDGESMMNVLYTSGSTGMPKGVALPHRGVIRLVHQANFAQFDATEVVPQLSPLNFDGATFEIWGTLCNGGTLLILEKEIVLAPKELSAMIHRHGVTTLLVTTPLLNRLIEDAPEALTPLRRVIFGGEVISKPHIKKALTYCQPNTLIHTYGPTENSFTSCYFPISEVDDNVWTIPIGRPVSHTAIYLLDAHLEPVPYGVIGELYLSGLGLAQGYLNDPARTEQAFLPHPFQPGERLYRTGDRARRLADGTIEFIGRKDNQVKIRSQRVELGEVESVLRRNPLVKECFVTTFTASDGGKQLAGYFVPAEGAGEHKDNEVRVLDIPAEQLAALRQFLNTQLPDYMIPRTLIALTDLPLNPNGKVNRRHLPDPADWQPAAAYQAPRTEIEKKIAAIWQDVLGVERVGLDDNFFDLGGHSLLVVKVHDALKEQLNATIRLMDLFQYTTVKSLTEAVSGTGEPETKPGLKPDKEATVPSRSEDNDIAIIGMALRFPEAGDPYEFWENLRTGRESISTIPDDQLEHADFHDDPAIAHRVVKRGGFLDDVFQFDPAFFNMSDREARLMDPQHRLFLECAWEAIENAGYDVRRMDGAVSLYAGAAQSSYLSALQADASLADAFQQDLMSQSTFLATRISYKLNLTGESLMVDTACSTSLVAVHMACQSLLLGQSEYALAGGVSLRIPQKTGYLYEPSFILSPDGHCRAFDADAQGTVEGNGAGVVLLKRLSDAQRDGDPIYAVIKGSAINNDGNRKIGYTAPSFEGQSGVIARAHRVAGVTADTIGYIEAHGTGTKLGDPIEVEALTHVFRASTDRTQYCGLGSVKSNIGHLGSAAGVAGLIKAALAIKHAELPPTLHYKRANPEIDFANSPFYVCDTLRPWESKGPRRAGVSSFGIGGTNAHVILEEAPRERTEGTPK